MSKILENQSQLPAAFSMRKLANNLIYYCENDLESPKIECELWIAYIVLMKSDNVFSQV